MQLQESGQNYLEAILMIQEEKGYCRSIDVARKLGFSKPSVSHAMSILREAGYVTVNQDGWLTLTQSGLAVAQSMYERHRLLSSWLISLGVPEEIALEDACKMEHDLSDISFAKLKAFLAQSGETES